jgi:uncharacterized protein (TIGR02001 family)
MTMIRLGHVAAATALALGSTSAFADVTANAGISNNYLWRGLTQTNNEAQVFGGIDYASADGGFYIGTWVSNVEYASDDTYSYEHDVYLGWTGGEEDFSWDVGWLYYNYDDINNIDFHELYGTIGFGGFSVTGYLLTGTEADEPSPAFDFGAGQAYYLSLNYAFETEKGLGIGLHAGRHSGDFNEYFNGVPGDYTDYSVSLSVDNFTLTLSDTDLNDYSPGDNLDNDQMKFVVSYSMEFGL